MVYRTYRGGRSDPEARGRFLRGGPFVHLAPPRSCSRPCRADWLFSPPMFALILRPVEAEAPSRPVSGCALTASMKVRMLSSYNG